MGSRIEVYIKDNIAFDNIRNTPERQIILSSVNTSTHGIDLRNNVPYESGKLHKLIRYMQFKSFDETIRRVYDECDILYLKLGGLCFLNDFIKERYDTVKSCLDFIIQHDYVVDPLGNNLLHAKTEGSNVFDKIILEKVLQSKDTDLIYYRPLRAYKKDDFLILEKRIMNASPEDIKSDTTLVRRIF